MKTEQNTASGTETQEQPGDGNRRVDALVRNFALRSYLILTWPLLWVMDVGMFICKYGKYKKLRKETSVLWRECWKDIAPND